MTDVAGFSSELLETRMDDLRNHKLDLTRRNPLINMSISGSKKIIRVVDELPDELFTRLSKGMMRFQSLPPFDDDPKDEGTPEFENALKTAIEEDETYLTEMAEQAGDDSESEEAILRDLKDRLREKLGLPPRQTPDRPDLAAHAKAHHINPSYELPRLEEAHDDGRHGDDLIQTLMDEALLSARADAIISSGRRSMDQTGTHVVMAAIGFIDFVSSKDGSTYLSPLLIFPVSISKERTARGLEFKATSAGEIRVNETLALLLSNDFGVEIPAMDDEDNIQTYLDKIENLRPRAMTHWKVKRQFVFTELNPSAIAMYNDMDPGKWDTESLELAGLVLAQLGEEREEHVGASGNFEEDHNIDSAFLQDVLPTFVCDADSSQASVVIDTLNGKNLAVEGPPGSGKSQTIVNTIAAAMEAGKRVLFVAEKKTAIDVVLARLAANNLGEFALSFQGAAKNKREFVEKLQERMNSNDKPSSSTKRKIDALTTKYRDGRDQINKYLDSLDKPVDGTDLTVFEVLGNAIAAEGKMKILSLPDSLRRDGLSGVNLLTSVNEEHLHTLLATLRDSRELYLDSSRHFEGLTTPLLDRINLDQLALDFKAASDDQTNLTTCHQEMAEKGLLARHFDELDPILQAAKAAEGATPAFVPVALEITNRSLDDKTAEYIKRKAQSLKVSATWDAFFGTNDHNKLIEMMTPLVSLMKTTGIDVVSNLDKDTLFETLDDGAEGLNDIEEAYAPIATSVDRAGDLKLSQIETLRAALSKVDPRYLKFINRKWTNKETLSGMRDALFLYTKYRDAETKLSEIADISAMGDIQPDELDLLVQAAPKGGILGFLLADTRNARAKLSAFLGGAKLGPALLSTLAAEYRAMREATVQLTNEPTLSLLVVGITNPVDRGRCGSHLHGLFSSVQDIRGQSASIAREVLLKTKDDVLASLGRNPTFRVVKSFPNEPFSETPQRRDALVRERDQLEGQWGVMAPLLSRLRPETSLEELGTHLGVVEQIRDNAQFFDDTPEVTDLIASLHEDRLADFVAMGPLVPLSRALASTDPERRDALAATLSDADNPAGALQTMASTLIDRHHVFNRAVDQISERIQSPEDEKSALRSRDAQWFDTASTSTSDYQIQARYLLAQAAVLNDGLGLLVQEMHDHPKQWEEICSSLMSERRAKLAYSQYGKLLAEFGHSSLDTLRTQVAEADAKIIELGKDMLRYNILSDTSVPPGRNAARVRDKTGLALLQHIDKTPGARVTVRQVINRASDALMALMPCWMMAPQDVSMLLPRQAGMFDLVLIDEASQMRVEDALPGLLRSKQSVITGDSQQMPPSQTFVKSLQPEDDDEDAVIEESILDLAKNAFPAQRMLNWHYRSRHSGLIAFSNHHMYRNNLTLFPSATERREGMGVHLHKVDNALFDKRNEVEAAEVVAGMVRFMTDYPKKSIGVVAMNQAQAEWIERKFDEAAQKHAPVRSYLSYWKSHLNGMEEPFICSLESVQGKERDTILISTTYAKRKADDTALSQNFGPINAEAGRRRLNVLVTRARERIDTYTSMDPSDINVGTGSGTPGRRMLRDWIEYSATGQIHTGKVTAREPDSAFEEHVISVIEGMGFDATPQVGVAGYFVDIGVSHPDWPYGYILGVECDGASFHSGTCARDRDRLRQSVLEGLGWNFHRIWSTDWFNSQSDETERLKASIEDRFRAVMAEHPPAAVGALL